MNNDIKLDADYAICNPTFRESFTLEDVANSTKKKEELKEEFNNIIEKLGKDFIKENTIFINESGEISYRETYKKVLAEVNFETGNVEFHDAGNYMEVPIEVVKELNKQLEIK